MHAVTPEQIDAFRRGTLSADEVVRVGRHIRTCVECRAAAAHDPAIRRVVHELTTAEHPDLAALFDFSDGTFDAAIAEHVLGCAQCREDVDDAKAERGVLRPSSSVLPRTQDAGRRTSSRLWPAAAALAIVLAGGAWWLTRPAPSPAAIHHPLPVSRDAGPPENPIVAEARRMRGVPMPAVLARLQGTSDSLRGDSAAAAKLDMRPHGVVVMSDRPRFTWKAQSGERYRVTVACDALTLRSVSIGSGAWTPDRSLPRGADCEWQLERESDQAIFPPPPAAQPSFHVLDAQQLATIESAEAQHDELVTGLLCARAGLRGEAIAHLETYLRTHPSDAVAVDILRSIHGWPLFSGRSRSS